MKDPRRISILDYTYTLPDERIARYPLPERDAARLLLFRDGQIGEDCYRRLATHLPAFSLLIFNNSRVVQARLPFRKPTGGIIEVFCLEPHPRYGDLNTALTQRGRVYWHCLIGGASKWKPGQVLEMSFRQDGEDGLLQAQFCAKEGDVFVIELFWTPEELSFADVLQATGEIPLPPYLKREAEAPDRERYQTVYAQEQGSVAAPTAGLHFTEHIFQQLHERNIGHDFVTLHVGAGTFKPVKAGQLEEHDMHAEWIDVSTGLLQQLLQSDERPVIAVGTTSLRTLETLYWLGVKITLGKTDWGETGLEQWEAYDLAPQAIPVREALQALLAWLLYKGQERLITRTRILIAPGYELKMADALITNFHQPQSTLLLLVAAVIGDDWRKVYDYALSNDFRFLSYGDGSLLFRKNKTTP